MNEVPNNLRVGIFLWFLRLGIISYEAIGNKSSKPSSKNTSEQDREEEKYNSRDALSILEVPMTDNADAMSNQEQYRR